jgi:prepilin-type N-terminal cleavage/methylation domain-containing protein
MKRKDVASTRCSCGSKPRLLSGDGFSLIEVMIAMVVLLVGLLGFLGLQITAIQVNEVNKRLIIAQETATKEIEDVVKTIGYTGLKNNTALLSLDPGDPNKTYYYSSLGSLPSKYQFTGMVPPIDQSCGAPFTYCVYKGVTVKKKVNNGGTDVEVDYDHTLKLSVVAHYLSYPVLEKCKMDVYWKSRDELKTLKNPNPTDVGFETGFVFFNEYKP